MSILINVRNHIILEDDAILVVHKPAGLMVEPDRNGYPNLQQQVKKYLKTAYSLAEPVYAQHLHRLDRPVSGVVLFAKHKTVLRNLSEQFAQRQVEKYYQALTYNRPEALAGMLANWHKKEKKKAVLVEEQLPGTEHASLKYTVAEVADHTFLWKIELHTGKYHQIRAQLAAVGCPIIGDNVYGSTQPYKPDSIALHAAKLVFRHPITHEKIIAEIDASF